MRRKIGAGNARVLFGNIGIFIRLFNEGKGIKHGFQRIAREKDVENLYKKQSLIPYTLHRLTFGGKMVYLDREVSAR